MPIAKPPKSVDRKALDFIMTEPSVADVDDERIQITLRLKGGFLKQIDQRAKRLNTTRSGWIKSVLSRALESDW